MRCKILHEGPGRMRVHAEKKYMTFEFAEILEEYLNNCPWIYKAKVFERSCNFTLDYCKDKRDEIIKCISDFDFEEEKGKREEEIDVSSRELRHGYEDKMGHHIMRRFASMMFCPIGLRSIITLIRAVPYVKAGIKKISEGKMEVEVLDATSISVSIIMGNFSTASNVMFLLKIGEIMEEWIRKKSVDDLVRAMSLNVDKVWLCGETGEKLVPVNKVKVGSSIVVRNGNVIPLDGVVLQGNATVNQASITGESLPVAKSAGGYIYAGTVVDEGEIIVTVKNVSGEGQYDRIVKMIEESEKLKSDTESKALGLADRLVPYTFGATIFTYLLTRNVTRAVSILMVDFCCALKLSMPIAVLSAIREAKDNNITIKGGKFLEAVDEAETIVFDKTGTLTKACPVVKDIVTFDGFDRDEALRLAACLEEHYPHSMASAVVKAAEDKGLEHEEKHSKVEYVVAHGIVSSIDNKKVLIGSYHFIFEDEDCVIPEGEEEKFNNISDEYSRLFLALGGKLIGVILIEDPLKKEAYDIVNKLHKSGFTRVVMLTGDNKKVASKVAEEIGVDDFKYEVLPADKADFITAEHEMGRKVIMVGDGVNDSPALSAADAGVAINTGAAIAKEVADITIADENLESLIVLKELSKALTERISKNYREILGFNSLLIILGMLGVLSPSVTAALHNASTVFISAGSTTDLLEYKK